MCEYILYYRLFYSILYIHLFLYILYNTKVQGIILYILMCYKMYLYIMMLRSLSIIFNSIHFNTLITLQVFFFKMTSLIIA